jgi:hypothetical protein
MRRAATCLAAALSAALPVVVAAQDMVSAEAGILRWIDRLTGETGDMELARGQSATNGRLTILLDDCRYPASNPAGDAEAHLTIHDTTLSDPVFEGWMIASSPALSALDHPRFDVWVLGCALPERDQPADDATSEGEGE